MKHKIKALKNGKAFTTHQIRAYATALPVEFFLLNRLYQKIEKTTPQDPHPGLIIATHYFCTPYITINEVTLLSLAAMDLLIQFAYPSLSGYGKFTISLTMKRSSGEITFTICDAIPLTYEDCKLIPKSVVYAHIYRSIQKYSEIYNGSSIIRLMIRVYMEGKKMERLPLSEDVRDRTLSSIIQAGLSEIDPITAREIRYSKHRYKNYITALKPCRTELKPFMVADIETLMLDDVHKPYAAGVMMVRPGEEFNDIIDTYFCEDYSIIMDTFEEKSTKVLYDLVLRISTIARQEASTLTIFFHNFSRFDGIILLKHLACHHKSYKLKPLMRNNRLYELVVYSGKKMLFRFRDSLNLLPGKLDDLAKNLCPGLGPKGSIPYSEVTVSSVGSMKKILLDYMRQDILLLGGIMQKAQEIYWKLFMVDIESKITISSLALHIFRLKYYDASNWPIHIPNQNEDSFIRRGYYGGHTDVYKPYGEDLFYYDVNSLYPFVMKEFPMPGGVPVWHGDLEGKDLESMCGFIEAYVSCPKTIKKPFLPYRDRNETLIFPTGEFVGVYYSEELKYARGLGYTVLPISGYLFERMESPFKHFVSSLFESRLEARKEGNEAMAYVYKILMNSLYGRFGINPKSTTTELCDEARYKHLWKKSGFIHGDMLSENNYIVAYHSNTDKGPDYWNPPKNSAVQLAAAITASARIYMYPYISRDDCIYTDTDSVVLGQPLPNSVISSSVLGKFKLEDRLLKGYFLAPKTYMYQKMGAPADPDVVKFKGLGKEHVNPEWFKLQHAEPSRTERVEVKSNFRINRHNLDIYRTKTLVELGIKLEVKRKSVYCRDVWVDTDPIYIEDLSSLDHISKKVVNSLKNVVIQLQTEKDSLLTEKQILVDQLSQREREIAEREREIAERYKEMKSHPTLDEKTQTDEEEPTRKTWSMYPDLMDNLSVKKRIKDQDDPDPPKTK